MPNRACSSDVRATVLLCLLLLLSTGISLAPAQQTQGPQEEMIPEEAQQQEWSKAFQEAEKVFTSENQSACIPLFQDLIAKIVEQRVKRNLTDPERLMLVKSLDYLGQALFLEGQQEECTRVFLKLIELDPNYKMNEDLVSSKIIAFMEQIKSQNLGIVSIATDPDGATVKLDGNVVGTTNISAMYSLKGDHDLEISKPGYFPQKQTITVTPGKTQKINLALERSSSVAYFVTYPKGVEVLMGGKSLGVTGGEPSDRAQGAATEQNLPATDFSSEFAVSDLQPGEYVIEFRKLCWETPSRKITIMENKDYLFEPIVLVPSFAYLDISANDPQANIFIDNEYKGLAPKQKLQICSGKHVIKIKGPMGKFEKQIEVKKDQALSISAKLNPSLAFLGVVGPPESGSTGADELTAETVHQLSGLQKLNFQDSTDAVGQAGGEDVLRQIIAGVQDGHPDPTRKAKIQDLCNRMESDLLLVGLVAKEKARDAVEFYLLSNWSSMADVRVIQTSEAAQWDQWKAQLEYEEPLFEKRLGINLIDTAISPGAVIAQIPVKTFEDAQPLVVGDIIVAVNGKPVKNTAEVFSAMNDLQSADHVTLTVQRSGFATTVPIKMINSPLEIQFDNPELLFNRQLATFKNVFNGPSSDPTAKNVALLNIGLCYIHFAEYEEALAQLRQVQLSRSLGIGTGTVQFRMAQCYLELGSTKEAQDSLTEAARYSENTIDSDDGPPLAREIERTKTALP